MNNKEALPKWVGTKYGQGVRRKVMDGLACIRVEGVVWLRHFQIDSLLTGSSGNTLLLLCNLWCLLAQLSFFISGLHSSMASRCLKDGKPGASRKPTTRQNLIASGKRLVQYVGLLFQWEGFSWEETMVHRSGNRRGLESRGSRREVRLGPQVSLDWQHNYWL